MGAARHWVMPKNELNYVPDTQRGRMVCNKRFPAELVTITGQWFKDRAPMHISAADLAIRKAEKQIEYDWRCNSAREALADPARRAAIIEQLADKAAVALLAQGERLTAIKAGMVKLNGQADAVRTVAALTGKPVAAPVAPETLSGKPVTIEDVIKAWSNEYRQNDTPLFREPSDDAKAAKASVLRYMFETLNRPEDMRLVTAADLKEHRAYLIGDPRPGKRGRKPNAYDHLQHIKTLFAVAERNFAAIPVNVAAGLQGVAKSRGTRLPFDDAERDAVLLETATAEPRVKWAHRIAAYTSAIPSELRWLTPASFRRVDPATLANPAELKPANFCDDGIPVVIIAPPAGHRLKTEYRPRIIPLHPDLLPVLDWVEQVRRDRGDNALLFGDVSKPMFSAAINAPIAKLAERPELAALADPRKCFYSHRHYVLTELDGRTIVDDEGRNVDSSYVIGGHVAPDVHKRNYVKVRVGRLVPAIETLRRAP